jgi:cephalosporin-C deacetylase-like acetyl esterase
VAAALGETGIPRDWRVLVVRHRAARPGEAEETSALPPVVSSSFYGPVRYRRLILSDADPERVQPPAPAYRQPPLDGLAGELAALDSRVWSPLLRRARNVRTMVSRQQRQRAHEAILAERRAWETVQTRADWERFRDTRIRALRESTGQFPPERPPLDVRVTARHSGRGYRLENLVYQSRPGFYVTANLYLPERPAARMPGIIIVHSQHYPKTQGELHDMGELWARTGAAVLVMERPGYGERAETNTWYRQAYGSRYTFTKQLYLVGESYSGWAAWDIIRAVDVFHERPDIDRDKIILLGSVAGGGEPAGVAAALDPRISAVVPFNYDQGHIRVHGDSPGQIARQFHPWVVAASVAPRRFVRAFEFGWEGAEEPDYPDLWVDGMERSRKVWAFYGASDNLSSIQAYGLIRLSMERVSHCFSIGPQQREELYPILQRWFGIPLPSAEDLAILPDSELSVSPQREAARRQEAERRRPHADLLSIPPAVAAQLPRRKLHEIAHAMGVKQLEAARAARRPLRESLRPHLGDIEPAASPRAETLRTRQLTGATVEALEIDTEPGITVPALLLRPVRSTATAVVVAVAQGGKDRFLSDRAATLEALLRAGVAVCLPDVRGTGETSPASARSGDGGPHHSMAQMEFDLGNSLLGARLKDLRTVVRWLRTRPDVDPKRIALWGEAFAEANPRDLFLDEVELEGGPQIQYRSEPLGAHLALLAALYEENIRAVAAQGGLAGYLTMLEDAFTYTPIDVVVHGILKAGDLADIAAALAPRPLRVEGAVNGRNIRLEQAELDRVFEPARQAYRRTKASDRLAVRPETSDPAAWLIEQLR